jgi:hypothetical protein
MNGICQCGCGQRTPIAQRSSSAQGHVKGEPMLYLKGHRRSACVNPDHLEAVTQAENKRRANKRRANLRRATLHDG